MQQDMVEFTECPDCPPETWVNMKGPQVRYRRLEHVSDWDVDDSEGWECRECGHAFMLRKKVVERVRVKEYDGPSRAEREAEEAEDAAEEVAELEAKLAEKKARLLK